MSENIKTILFFSIDFPPHPGGMARHCFDAALALAQRGYRVAVITADASRNAALPQALEVIRIKGVPYAGLFDDYAGSVRQFVVAGVRYCWRHRVDFCFANTWTIAGVAAMCVGWFCRVPYAVFAHGLDVQSGAAVSKAAWLMRRVFACARAVIANSLFTRQLVNGHAPANKTIVVYPAVQERRLAAGPGVDPRLAGRRFMLTVARLVESKGIDTVIRCLPEVLRQCNDICYCVVGSGAQERDLKDLAASLGVNDRVVFAGAVNDEALGAYYAGCEFFVMTSRPVPLRQEVEGFGIVFLEAALFAKPAIGSRCGGIPEAVADGESGFIVASDDVAATAAAAVRLFNDTPLLNRMGEQARRRVLAEFALESFGVRLAGLIDQGKRGSRV